MPITLVTGGASSGKSKYALSMIQKNTKAIYVATGVSTDSEMEERIKRHKSERPSKWETIEEPIELLSLFNNFKGKTDDPIIIDCLTFWVSNLMFYRNFTREKILKEANTLSEVLSQYKNQVIIVTNELGMGIIPADRETRIFRIVAGEVNQIFSGKATEVFLVVSGIGIKIKSEQPV